MPRSKLPTRPGPARSRAALATTLRRQDRGAGVGRREQAADYSSGSATARGRGSRAPRRRLPRVEDGRKPAFPHRRQSPQPLFPARSSPLFAATPKVSGRAARILHLTVRSATPRIPWGRGSDRLPLREVAGGLRALSASGRVPQAQAVSTEGALATAASRLENLSLDSGCRNDGSDGDKERGRVGAFHAIAGPSPGWV